VTQAKRKEDLVKVRWTLDEEEAIRRVYPRGTIPEILAALPGRKMRSISVHAFYMGVKCEARRHLAKVVSVIIERGGVRGKACTKCLEWKPLEKFARHATCAEGRRNRCTTCEGRSAYAGNPKLRNEVARRYQKNHPEKMKVHRLKAHMKRREILDTYPTITVEQLREIREVFGDLCVYCGDPADTLDHVVPLTKGGEHAVHNLVPACRACNCSKHNKLLSEWRGRNRSKG
jgi:5-methylcytosine-specific restriction endonuclease McrA